MRKTVMWTAIALCAVAAPPLLSQGRSGGRVAGRDIYSASCASCHGPEGRGNGPVAAALNPRPTDFANAAQRQATRTPPSPT